MSEEEHAQAGPLPTKRGEIGFVEEAHGREGVQDAAAPSGSTTGLPPRHPADRSYTGGSRPSTSSLNIGDVAPGTEAQRAPSPSGSQSSQQSAGKHSILSFMGEHKFGGLEAGTLLALFLQLGVLVGTIIVWWFIVTHIKSTAGSAPLNSSSNSDQSTESNSQQSSSSSEGTLSSTIFVHAAFIIATIGELVFLERTIFRLRAERYAHKHPGEILPSARRRAQGRVGMGFNPWNRVDLPSYAAALRESGARTGDVEDGAIAVPPPPTYGDYRTSTLLLAGPRQKRQSTASQASSQRPSRPTSQVSTNGLRPLSLRPLSLRPLSLRPPMMQHQDRPVSYRSHDSSWEEVLDADRAHRLEGILNGIEEGEVTEPARPRAPGN